MEHSRNIVKAKDEVAGVKVINISKENLGEISEVMLDKISGKIAYVVLDSRRFLGLGRKLFAIPWQAIRYDQDEECFILNAYHSTNQATPRDSEISSTVKSTPGVKDVHTSKVTIADGKK